MASDHQLHFVLQSLNYSTLYDLTHGQFKVNFFLKNGPFCVFVLFKHKIYR